MTFRVVHPNGPGTVYFETHQNFGYGDPEEVYGYIIGPEMGGGPDCDIDGDGEVDFGDLDLLCANMGGDPATYDFDGDGDVDEDDLYWFIEHCLELIPGDLNGDGVVNATDLAILREHFGEAGFGYAEGNINCDDYVNATDLLILKEHFGQSSAGGAVPEPLSLLILGVGALPLLKRRKG